MEIKINKEIRRYQENIFFGLSVRQFACSILALGMAIGVYFLLKNPLGEETVSWLCILAAVPVAATGFFQYNGLTLEQFILAWFKSEFLFAGPRKFVAENYYLLAMDEAEKDKAKQRKDKRRPEETPPPRPAAKRSPPDVKRPYKKHTKENPAYEKNTGNRPVRPGTADPRRTGPRGRR